MSPMRLYTAGSAPTPARRLHFGRDDAKYTDAVHAYVTQMGEGRSVVYQHRSFTTPRYGSISLVILIDAA
jgi:hypothetical protein